MKIDVYKNVYTLSTLDDVKHKVFYFVKNKKVIARINCCYYNEEIFDIVCTSFDPFIPLNRLKQQTINLSKIELYEFIFNDFINILFNENKIRFPRYEKESTKKTFLMLKEYFNKIKGVD